MVTSDHWAGCDRIVAAGPHAVDLVPDWKCALPSYECVGGQEVSADVHVAVRQPLGECAPKSDLPCSCPRRSFADPPEQLPLPATKSNIPALKAWIRDHFKA